MLEFIDACMNKVLAGKKIGMSEAMQLMQLEHEYIPLLLDAADTIRREFNGNTVDIESLINAKSGNCSENCAFCAQSAWYKGSISKYPLLSRDTMVERAEKARCSGAKSFCIVCAWREPREEEFEQICDTIKAIHDKVGIDVNCSLGFLNERRAERLKDIGVKRYNHNLEASNSFFANICTTHTWHDRFRTARIAKEQGLELCSGGIIGMGESVKQRLELAFEASMLEPEEFPLNILIAREGTPLYNNNNLNTLGPIEILKTIAVFRFIIPRGIIKLAGGRELHLREYQYRALLSGANGIITNGYLTVEGNTADKDIAMIRQLGLEV